MYLYCSALTLFYSCLETFYAKYIGDVTFVLLSHSRTGFEDLLRFQEYHNNNDLKSLTTGFTYNKLHRYEICANIYMKIYGSKDVFITMRYYIRHFLLIGK